MPRPLLLLFAGACLSLDWSKFNYRDYCVPAEPLNTPCVTQCKVGRNCGEPITNFQELPTPSKQYLLDMHNQLREEIARGDYSDWGFPPATNMHALNWDEECEYMTTCWLKQCNFWHDKHVKPDGTSFGQNLHMRYTTGQFIGIDDTWLKHGMMAWFNEYKLLKDHPNIYQSFQPVKGSGHFTALIWHETKLVGCATNHFRRDGQEFFHLYCNYYPTGNWKNSPIYGTEPYDCKRGSKYTHLCGEVRDLKATPIATPWKALLLSAQVLLTTLYIT